MQKVPAISGALKLLKRRRKLLKILKNSTKDWNLFSVEEL
ncbi:hypothetical protein VTH82DRAFT_4077 [Thermothelomyces myriococcoides]